MDRKQLFCLYSGGGCNVSKHTKKKRYLGRSVVGMFAACWRAKNKSEHWCWCSPRGTIFCTHTLCSEAPTLGHQQSQANTSGTQGSASGLCRWPSISCWHCHCCCLRVLYCDTYVMLGCPGMMHSWEIGLHKTTTEICGDHRFQASRTAPRLTGQTLCLLSLVTDFLLALLLPLLLFSVLVLRHIRMSRVPCSSICICRI